MARHNNGNARTRRILNIELFNTTMGSLLEEYTSGAIYPLNIDTMVSLQEDAEFYRACAGAEFRVLDSQVLFFLAQLTGMPFKEKISGSDFFPRFCEHHKHNEEVRIFILGGMEDVAEIVRQKINRAAGRALVVGAYSPRFGFDTDETENAGIVRMINETSATALAVGLGAPKQEKWIMRHRSELKQIKMFIAVGATLDFMAGTQVRAPRWMQRSGLEWLYRLSRDPKRLFRRYLVRDLKFFYHFTKDMLGLYTNPF